MDFIEPAPFAVGASIMMYLMVVVGGSGYFLGPLLGAAVGVVVGRGFAKFFNLNQMPDVPGGHPEFWEKADGSLILLFTYEGQRVFATRGSDRCAVETLARTPLPAQAHAGCMQRRRAESRRHAEVLLRPSFGLADAGPLIERFDDALRRHAGLLEARARAGRVGPGVRRRSARRR